MGAHLLLTAALLLLWTPVAEALVEPEICYILDAILFLYGIVLTVLYCRLKFLAHRASRQGAVKEKEEAIYTVSQPGGDASQGGPYPQLLSLGGVPCPLGCLYPTGCTVLWVPYSVGMPHPAGAVSYGCCNLRGALSPPPITPPWGAPTLGVAPPQQPIAPRGPSLGHILGGNLPQ
ncbi:high affinity immunoglobulin epsilon receptor subunit gamma isoform X1 [Buteo buteo]|uniref:high affinity immunoglobulin epsilon receptor subunit gamma isoform X1 n=1 Tax=Buteo buteo TaxID=30397 RepID=UPI003EB8F4F0